MGLFDRNYDVEIANCKIDIDRKKAGIESFKKQLEALQRDKKNYSESQKRAFVVMSNPEQRKRHRELTQRRIEQYNDSIARKKHEIQALREWIDRIRATIERIRHDKGRS